jgi:Ferritin-like
VKQIETPKELRDHLQTAVEIEWSVIPPYLCALWSLHEDANELAAAILKDVLMEEMLHLTLAANVLIALGGRPRLVPPAAKLPAYPGFLPHSDDAFQISLLPFSEDAVKTFRRIEQPAAAGAPPQPDRYATIAQFYEALIDAVKTIGKDPAVWKGKGAPQVTGEYYYGGGGAAFRVDGLAKAVEALELITYEGEGVPGSVTDGDQMLGEPEELAHFFRFDELLKRRQYTLEDTPGAPTGPPILIDYAAVRPMVPNPRTAGYPTANGLRAMSEACDVTYSRLLQQLDDAFGGKPARMIVAVQTMKQLGTQAVALMNVPFKGGYTAGPAFEWRAPPPATQAYASSASSAAAR